MAKKEKFSNVNRMASESHPVVSCSNEAVHADPKWTEYLLKEEEEEKPKISLTERVNLMLKKEKQERETGYARGIHELNVLEDVEPVVPVKKQHKPSEEEIEENCNSWKEKLDLASKDYEVKWQLTRREMDCEKKKLEKNLIDGRPRDYYWKPNPLYSLHLKELGYSKLAVDRALFSVNNASAKAALEYLKANPDPKELTKEEVISVGEEALRKVRPGLQNPDYNRDIEMEEDSLRTGNFNNRIPVVIEEKGMKRSCNGHVRPEKKAACEKEIITKEETMLQVNSGENVNKYTLFLLRNLSVVMDKILLALECSKVAVKIMDKLFHGNDEVRTMLKEWEENGSTMEMYRVKDSDILREFQKEAENRGYINYMAETSQYIFEDAPSPTVLGFFGENKLLPILIENLRCS